MRVTMDADGRLVIPAEIRAEAGLAAGAPLEIRVRNGRVEIEPAEIAAAATSASASSAATVRAAGLSLVKGRASGAGPGAARQETERPSLDLLIRMAIAHRRLVELVYDGRRKLVEPHDYGERGGVPQLLVYQLSGESRSASTSGWRALRLPLISDFRVLDDTFPGGREADRHIAWDRLYARVDPST